MIAALAGAVAIAVAATLVLGSSSAAAVKGPSRLLTAHFKLLRSKSPSSLAAPPRSATRSFSMGFRTPSADKLLGLDSTAARGTQLPDGVKVWLIPGRKGACFWATGPGAAGGGCGYNNKEMVARGFEQYQRYGAKQRIVGIAPDGSHITVRLSDGSSVPVRLNPENAYVIVRPIGDAVVKTTFTGNGRTFGESSIGLRRPLSSPAPA